MTHVWQHVHGKPSARGYHNREWAAKMKAIGLQPSSTGMVGGKETGQRMSDYVIPDGPFTKAYAKLATTGWRMNLQSAPRPGAKGGVNSKTKFTCSSCGQNAWGKPQLAIGCKLCGDLRMLAADIVAVASPAPSPSYDPPELLPVQPHDMPTVSAAPRKRGRPKGSKNKPKDTAAYEPRKRKRGRPKGDLRQANKDEAQSYEQPEA
jgi:hypothetical protein